MIRRSSIWTCILLLSCAGSVVLAKPPVDPDPEYTRVLDKRADDVLAALKLDDDTKADRIRETLIAQYRALRDIHDGREAKLKAAPKDDKEQIDRIKSDADASLKRLHDGFLAKLGRDLAPEQIEIVKDKMTMGKVKNDYDAFLDMLPELTDAQKAYILAQLKEAREIAMDQGSSEAKHAVFGKYRGRINNYLAKEGYDLKQASKDWAERRKAREAQRPTTQPRAN